MFKIGEKIPDNYIKPIKTEPTYISEEQRQKNIEKLKQRCKNSKWYNNGKHEKFCIIGTQPTGYILGRLPTINVGRKYSKETLEKIRTINYETIKLDNNLTLDQAEDIIRNKEYDVKEKNILDISIYGNVSFNPYLINFEDIKQVLKEKYNLLHIEINNFINILSSNLEIDNIIDIKSIEEQSIKNYISINHPDINDIDITIKEIQDLKNSLIDNKEYDVIINNMIDDGE